MSKRWSLVFLELCALVWWLGTGAFSRLGQGDWSTLGALIGLGIAIIVAILWATEKVFPEPV